ncbi:hypothetical protein PUN28_017817 [Cardiocondyla obscurior]|uniref:Uncharacterized protein n=1 Tax=Cardiocondyla obscurior TaxID=286306 RepID=A0AAW2ELC4_9HYME
MESRSQVLKKRARRIKRQKGTHCIYKKTQKIQSRQKSAKFGLNWIRLTSAENKTLGTIGDPKISTKSTKTRRLGSKYRDAGAHTRPLRNFGRRAAKFTSFVLLSARSYFRAVRPSKYASLVLLSARSYFRAVLATKYASLLFVISADERLSLRVLCCFLHVDTSERFDRQSTRASCCFRLGVTSARS